VSEATAIAHPNVALSKYWGKRAGGGNFPAVPSLSVTLKGLSTRTRVVVVELVDRVRKAASESRRAEVTSRNDFPTASGLASSASGFAALALAASSAAGLDWDRARVSDLARRSSASAARSLFGGFVELAAGAAEGSEERFLAAVPVAPPEHLPLVVLVCVTADGPKLVGSTEGMRITMARSPYAAEWIREAPRLHERLRDALLARDFPLVGALAEASALAMHASAIAAGVTYWVGATLDALAAVRALRAGGTSAFATIDAGPHVKVLVQPGDAPRARGEMERVVGIKRIIEARPGEAAHCETKAESAP
jgi:diphosphomevalonate decarboxylase